MTIERASSPVAWGPEVFLGELSRPQARVDLVKRAGDGFILAFANYWIVADEVHLLNIATHPEARRLGHGRRLIAHLFEVATQRACRLVTLEVRRSNEAAQALYRALGFQSVGVRPGYYTDNAEDALLMTRNLL